MKRFNPYKRHSCAWCYSSNTDIITDPKRDHSRESDFNFYINRRKDPREPREPKYDDNFFKPSFREEDEYINNRDRYPRLPSDERDFTYNLNNFIIECFDCSKYSEVYIHNCMNCTKQKININRIINFIDVDNKFNIKPRYLCIDCEYVHYKPNLPCNHNFIKHSGEIFSIGAVFTLKCTHCGEQKTSYPNNDNPHQPYNDNYPHGDGY